jgi:23S rRNA (guanosine2251-2'-O)-methyltransferase
MKGERLPPRDQLIMGVHAAREVLRHDAKRLIRVFAEKKKSDLLEALEEKGVAISIVPGEMLTRMVGTDSHQGIVAHVRGRSFLDVREFLKTIEEKESSLVVMADQIFDPQNFGAILRCAEALGADAVVWSKNRGTDITPSVAKASSGASELMPLIRVSNLAEAVSQFQEGGFEAVASILEPSSESAYSFRFSPRTLVIVGSEGEGIQPLIRKRADKTIFIPMEGKIESLNVSQATAILITLYKLSPISKSRPTS